MDPIGSLLSIATLVGLVFAVIEGPERGWTSTSVLVGAAVGLVALGAFLVWEARSDHPMLDLALFRDRRFSMGATSLTLLYFGALGTYFLYTQHLQFVLGYSPLRAGVYSVPFGVVLVAVSLQTPRAVRRFGTAAVAGTGLIVLAASVWLRATAGAHTGYPLLLISLMIAAVGVGSTIAPSTASIMSSLPPERAGVGSAINDAARQVGAAAGVAVLGSVWASSYHTSLAGRTARTEIPRAALSASRSSVGAALAIAHTLPAAPGNDLTAIAKAAFVHGSDVANVVAGVVAAVGAILALRFMPRRTVRVEVPATSVEGPAGAVGGLAPALVVQPASPATNVTRSA
jgi:predicted MFS family arabinose efflux permease